MKRTRGGFTLIELIIVIVIVGILAMVAIPRYFANIENARRSEALTTLRSICEAIEAYYAVNDFLPVAFPITATIPGGGSMAFALPTSPNFSYSFGAGTITAAPQIGAGSTTYTLTY